MEYVLRTQNLTKQFGEKTAVKNVSMQIKKGEIYGFIGKNGAGKTNAHAPCSGRGNADGRQY